MTRLLFAAICLLGFCTAISAQNILPKMNEWFLSTGSWENDPALYIREVGIGQRVIFMVHGGWGGEHSGLIEAVKGLENNYHFIFYDQRGSLRSPFPDSLISFDQHIDDLERLRIELKLDKITLVGHSMGAILTSAYATKYPQHVAQLVLISPPSLKEPLPNDDKELQHKEYIASQEFLRRAEVKTELEKYNLQETNSHLSSQEETAKNRISFGARMLYDIGKWPALGGGKVFYNPKIYELTAKTYPKSGWDYISDFKKAGYPVHIIIGDHDFLDFGAQLISKWVKGSSIGLSVIKQAGHVIWIDQPDAFRKVMLSSLR